MAWASTTPAAIIALVTALKAAADLATADVLDGPEVTASGRTESVTVGFQSEENPISVEAILSGEGYGTAQSQERYTILNAAAVLNGAGDISQARTRAYQMVAVVGAVLAADNTLGGAVMAASLGAMNLRQMQDSAGATAVLEFGVDVHAFTQA